MTDRVRMRHLRCFRAVARSRSMTRAAELLNTVQPAVSRSIKELEDELGTQLFDRTPKGLFVTEAGRTLLAYVSNGLIQIDQGVSMLSGQSQSAKVTAYVMPNVIRRILPRPVARFKEIHPEVDLCLLPILTHGLYDNLISGHLDFGFGRLLTADQMKGMSFEFLFKEPLAFMARAGHPLAGRPNISLDEVDAFPVVVPNTETIIRDELDRYIISKGIGRFSNMIETISVEFSRSVVQVSDAIIVLPLGAFRQELDDGSVVRLDCATGELEGAVGLTTNRGKSQSVPVLSLMQLIRDEVEAQNLS